VITFDTSVLLSLADQREQNFDIALEVLRSNRPPFIIPMAIMSEICYLIEDRVGQRSLVAFLQDIAAGRFELDFGEIDLPRIVELVLRYQDMPLGYADAAVIACAERHGGRVATLDYRHFAAVAREGTIQIVP
jgi:predicted nucleic acid-binding protein